MKKNNFQLYQSIDEIKKNDLIVINDNGEVRKATTEDINIYYDYQQLYDELVDYVYLDSMDVVVEIIHDIIRHSQEKVFRAMRMKEEHFNKECTLEKCKCSLKYYNLKVKEQKVKEEEFKKQNY